MAETRTKTQDDKTRDMVIRKLGELGSKTVGDDALVFEGTKFVLPANMRGKIGAAVKYLRDYEEQQETTFSFSRTFNYRPWDGANAFQNAMKKLFGTVGIGQITRTFFGDYPPEYRTVNVDAHNTIQIPWGRVGFSPLDATFILGGARNDDFGIVFQLSVEAPRKWRAHIEAFFQAVELELRTNSIYQGKAFTGGGEPLFLDTSAVDPERVVYSNEVMIQLETNMWSLLRYTERMRENKIPLKRAVLVEGPYGTGKTLAGQLTAKEAVENGWTFILARPGKDDLMEVLQTAQLYAPAVVWYEDIDTLAVGHSDMQISKLLDALDGITNKGVEVLAGFTTNHVEKIQKGVLRPGRLDAVIKIEGLDAAGFEKLVRVVLPENLLGEIDFAQVAKAFDGLLPAFAKEAIDRAMRYSITRNKGIPDLIHTEDLVYAADGLRPQLALMDNAKEGVKVSPIESRLKELVAETIGDQPLVDEDGDERGFYFPAAEKMLNGHRR